MAGSFIDQRLGEVRKQSKKAIHYSCKYLLEWQGSGRGCVNFLHPAIYMWTGFWKKALHQSGRWAGFSEAGHCIWLSPEGKKIRIWCAISTNSKGFRNQPLRETLCNVWDVFIPWLENFPLDAPAPSAWKPLLFCLGWICVIWALFPATQPSEPDLWPSRRCYKLPNSL